MKIVGTAMMFFMAFQGGAFATPHTTLEFRLVVDCDQSDSRSEPMVLTITNESLCVSKRVIADGSDIASLDTGPDRMGIEGVRIILKGGGARRMEMATAAHQEGRMGVVLNDELIAAPFIHGTISNDLFISLGESGERLKEIVAAMRSSVNDP